MLQLKHFLKLFLTVFLVLYHSSPHAGVLYFAWDNDLLVAKDRGYTNGLRLSWLGQAKPAPNTASMHWLPGFSLLNDSPQQAYGVSLRQSIITPEDIETVPPVLNDLPYAGHLSFDTGVFKWTRNTLIGYEFSLGVVGPESGAESTQRWFHKMIGSSRPEGWHHQLGTDWQAGISTTFGQRFSLPKINSLEQEWILMGRGSLDTYRTGAELGVSWRLGKNLPFNFMPDYASLSSAAALPGLFEHNLSGWSIFAGASSEWVPHSYLGKNSSPYQYRQEQLVWHAGIGAALHRKSWHLALALRASTDQDVSHDDALTFGTLSMSWLF